MARTARYLEIAERLRLSIEQGQYPVGTQLPTEGDLCSEFGVSRYTVREALRSLKEMGLISRRQGSGSVVEAKTEPTIFTQATGTVEDLLQYAAVTDFHLEQPEDVVAEGPLARILDCDPGTRWILRRGKGLDRQTGEVIVLTDIYLADRLRDIVPQVNRNNGPIFTQLEKLANLRIERVNQSIQAVLLTKAQAKIFGVEDGSPGLRTIRWYLDRQGVVNIGVNIHPGERYIYSMKMNRDPSARTSPST